jgi:arsenite methyltransferase
MPVADETREGEKADWGVDAPAVMRNFFLFGVLCVAAGFLLPRAVHLGNVTLAIRPMFFGTGTLLLIEGLLYLLYVKVGKLKHRDYMLSLHTWRGDEQVLDVGCGRGLLLAGAAKRLTGGRATGIDLWSTEDMGGNSAETTLRNLRIEGVSERCEVLSRPAQAMEFADGAFDVVVSNLCLHNIYDAATREQALREIARVLRPGGVAILSDYKLTGEYAKALATMGFEVRTRRNWRDWMVTFPPLAVVEARKPLGAS